MPQPKKTWLDRIFGDGSRRKPVPPNKPVATSATERPTREEPPTVATRTSAEAEQEPGASSFSVLEKQQPMPSLPPEIGAGLQRTATEIGAIQDAAVRQQQALQHAVDQERALYGMSQQQMNYTQAFREMQRISGANEPLQGDPDPRHYLPHWKRYYGDLGKGFLGGGGK